MKIKKSEFPKEVIFPLKYYKYHLYPILKKEKRIVSDAVIHVANKLFIHILGSDNQLPEKPMKESRASRVNCWKPL